MEGGGATFDIKILEGEGVREEGAGIYGSRAPRGEAGPPNGLPSLSYSFSELGIQTIGERQSHSCSHRVYGVRWRLSNKTKL